jgi:hypothetical protein
MIRVTRQEQLAPAPWLTRAQAETAQAIQAYKAALAAYRKLKGRDKKLGFTFKYKVYGDDLLRDALNQVYGFKCAYCETYFAGQPVAVEHYRPKGAVIEGKDRLPGYYWLAATWRNLLPSCTDCNSPRRQEMADGKKVVRGKGNRFPLAPGSRRARAPGQEARENPLLLHPEIDFPEKHVEFAVDRQRAGIIRPALQNGQPSPKGVASIDVYALDRPQLTQARADFAIRLLAHLRNTRQTEADHRARPGDARLKKRYDENLAELLTFIKPGQPYCAMARQMVRAELPGLKI